MRFRGDRPEPAVALQPNGLVLCPGRRDDEEAMQADHKTARDHQEPHD
jgi:hypothetical protein